MMVEASLGGGHGPHCPAVVLVQVPHVGLVAA